MQSYPTFQARYQAIRRRDSQAVGHFFYGVLSTGIYCRPDCASRQPLIENVRFFDSTASAIEAGFRACKRCRPDSNEEGSLIQQKVSAMCRMIETAESSPTLDQLSRSVGWSPAYLQRVFKAEMGMSPKAYSRQIRIQRVQKALSAPQSITQAAHQAGFASTSHYYSEVKKMGILTATKATQPRADIKTGKTMISEQEIHYQLVSTSLGFCLMAATEKGLCAVSLGDDEEALLAEFTTQFSAANLLDVSTLSTQQDQDTGGWKGWFSAVIEQVNSASWEASSLPLDTQGTLFQQQVWQALRTIPRGETRTYSEVAELIGKPNSVRAVATACAANKIALLIPCHRVLRKGGLLAGYRWGLARKKALLERESRY